MDPAIEHQDLRPPSEPRLPWAVLLAVVVNVLLIVVVAWGIEWKRGPRHEIAASAPAQVVADDADRSSSAPVAQARTECPLRPRLAAAGGKDGQVFPPLNVEGKTEKDIEALLLAGKEAAAAGQVRDAEVDYLTSCRVADALKGAGSVESANARYQLARHYANAANAATKAPAAQRTEIFGQAQAYYEDSLQSFRAKLGDSNEKTRFAAEGLEAARAALAQVAEPAASPGVAAAASSPAVATSPSAVATSRMGAGPDSPAAAQERKPPPKRLGHAVVRAASPKPSFDCRKARSYSERTICSDRHLAQLDRDLGRLHARAKQAARDPAAFRRQNDAEWHRREKTCRDRACLLRWYAERRQQLAASLGQASPPPDRTASR